MFRQYGGNDKKEKAYKDVGDQLHAFAISLPQTNGKADGSKLNAEKCSELACLLAQVYYESTGLRTNALLKSKLQHQDLEKIASVLRDTPHQMKFYNYNINPKKLASIVQSVASSLASAVMKATTSAHDLIAMLNSSNLMERIRENPTDLKNFKSSMKQTLKDCSQLHLDKLSEQISKSSFYQEEITERANESAHKRNNYSQPGPTRRSANLLKGKESVSEDPAPPTEESRPRQKIR
jgi:hypothetical protein